MNHEFHIQQRRAISFDRDLRAIENNKLPPHELRRAQQRLENSSNTQVLYIENNKTPLIITSESIEIRSGVHKKARRIINLPEIVSAKLPLKDGNPDYAGWLLAPGGIPDDHFGAVAEAVVWEMADRNIATPIAQFRNGILKFASSLIKTVNAEPDVSLAANKFAHAVYAFPSLGLQSQAGIECQILAHTTGFDAVANSYNQWQELDGVMAANPRVMDAIAKQIENTAAIPSQEFMADQIAQMKPVRVIEWV